MPEAALVETRSLTKYFYPNQGLYGRNKRYVKALEDVNLSIYRQETLGVVGESGCGKTTLGRVMLFLVQPTSGQVIFDGRDLTSLDRKEQGRFRRNMQERTR